MVFWNLPYWLKNVYVYVYNLSIGNKPDHAPDQSRKRQNVFLEVPKRKRAKKRKLKSSLIKSRPKRKSLKRKRSRRTKRPRKRKKKTPKRYNIYWKIILGSYQKPTSMTLCPLLPKTTFSVAFSLSRSIWSYMIL